MGLAGATGTGPKQTLVWVLVSWAVGLVLGGVAIGFGPSGFIPFLVAGRDPRAPGSAASRSPTGC